MKDFFARSALAKMLALLFLMVLLAVALSMIGELVHERGASREQAVQELAATHAGPQSLLGPVLVVPYLEHWTEEQRGEDGKVKARVARSQQRVHLVFPQQLALDGKLVPQERYRGIFTVLFYELTGRLSGRFPAVDAAALPRVEKGSTFELQPPVLALGLSDLRGLQGVPSLQLGGEAAAFLPRTPHVPEESLLSGGIHAPLPTNALAAFQRGQPLPFDLKLSLVGQERLSVVPLADETTARLVSGWRHPSFGGQFLAQRRTVGDSGFEASWAVSSLVTSARAQLLQAKAEPRVPRAQAIEALESFDVSLGEPLNVYSLSGRAVKYGILFVALALMATFMFELFARVRLHPVQYGLVGLSIALFFLLLLALSEKVAFGLAYAVAAGASVLLLTVYFGAVLRGWRRGGGLGAYVAALYGVLYGLLSSEDNALLLGSLLLFGLLALLMLGTRRVDWYALASSGGEGQR